MPISSLSRKRQATGRRDLQEGNMLHTSNATPWFRRRENRSGIVLLVVMAMLALFATVALSFVFYAEAEATISRYTSSGADAIPGRY